MKDKTKQKVLMTIGVAVFIAFYSWLRRLQGAFYSIIQQRGVKIFLQATFFGFAAMLGAFLGGATPLIASLWYLSVTVASALFITTGMGQYLTYPFSIKYTTAETFDFLLLPFFGRDPRIVDTEEEKDRLNALVDYRKLVRAINTYGPRKLYFRNFTGFTILGVLKAIPLSICLIYYGHVELAVMMTLLCGLQGAAYYFPWKLANYNHNKHPTLYAEYLTNLPIAIGFVVLFFTLWPSF